MMLTDASQSSVPPYWALIAGPKSHSPVPMEALANRIPGPMSEASPLQPNGGGAGRVPSFQRPSVLPPASSRAAPSGDSIRALTVTIIEVGVVSENAAQAPDLRESEPAARNERRLRSYLTPWSIRFSSYSSGRPGHFQGSSHSTSLVKAFPGAIPLIPSGSRSPYTT